MYKLPISCPKGSKPTIGQFYGDTTNLAWYVANGVNIPYHNGLDFCVGNSIQTYGTRLVCPVPNAELSKIWWENAMSSKGNGIQIAWEENGDRYNLIFWHCSEIINKPIYKEQDIVGYIGNSGLCKPSFTLQQPFNGSHLHLGLRKNNVLIDPLTMFNPNEWYVSEDTGIEKDLPPLFWVLEYVKSQLKLLTLAVAKWLKK